MRFHYIVGLLLLLATPAWAVTGVLENPPADSARGGVGLISGWVCDAISVTIVIDSRPAKAAAYGTSRGDTQAACGDSNNGFGLLFNFNLLDDGQHTIKAFADGVEFASQQFTTDRVSGTFATGLSRVTRVRDFPSAGLDTELYWDEAIQNFAILSSGGIPEIPDAVMTFAHIPGLHIDVDSSLNTILVDSLHGRRWRATGILAGTTDFGGSNLTADVEAFGATDYALNFRHEDPSGGVNHSLVVEPLHASEVLHGKLVGGMSLSNPVTRGSINAGDDILIYANKQYLTYKVLKGSATVDAEVVAIDATIYTTPGDTLLTLSGVSQTLVVVPML